MRVVILTQYFPPETGAPQNRLGDLSRRLRSRGHEVIVLTGMPNYPTGRIFSDWVGRITASETTPEGVQIERSWLYTSPKRSFLRQMLSYLTFAVSVACNGVRRVRRADAVIWESPPLFLAPAASLVARRSRARLVMNVSDLWPESAVELGMVPGRVVERLLFSFARWAYREADLVMSQTSGISAGVLKQQPDAAVALFPNGVDLDSVVKADARGNDVRQAYGIPDDAFLVGYVGNFGRAQDLAQVVEAARRWARDDTWLLLVGDGPTRPAIESLLSADPQPRVVLSGAVPQQEAWSTTAALDLAIVPLADIPLLSGARPSKMFELMALEVAFVFCGRGEGAALALQSGAASVCNPARPDELAQQVRQWRDLGPDERARAGRRGREYVASNFDRAKIAVDVERRLTDLVLDGGHVPL